MFTYVDIEFMQVSDESTGKQEVELNINIGSNACPSFTMEHRQNREIRRLDANLCGIFSVTDNLNESVDSFVNHCRRYLSTHLFPLSKSKNVRIGLQGHICYISKILCRSQLLNMTWEKVHS